MSADEVNSVEQGTQATESRTLPSSLVIPGIKGEMVQLRPATLDDLPLMDELQAYHNASSITGKDAQAERALVHTWVSRSVAWERGLSPEESGVGDPESRRTIAWSVLADSNPDDDDVDDRTKVIGMIFLIDIDSWAKSARIQVMLGRDYRGRGYSRDAMPRVMTYGFAPEPAGLGLHRIWVAVPEKNTRSLSVYQSLGFIKEGTSRHALWDDANQRYQDQIVFGTLVDEYDPIRSLDVFGMHLIEDNPGVKEALAAREHSLAMEVNDSRSKREAREAANDRLSNDLASLIGGDSAEEKAAASKTSTKNDGRGYNWPNSNNGDEDRNAKRSERAWWRNLVNRSRGGNE
ncbi:GNAT family N-acetyltransferase [Bifidobacterium catulorum]|uniref:N-acetyltransferase n=1 Tax=Bifidobacterium catulorum TaxID=1630173 RepID=A0A2U2MQ06_9BIFI|nr:GNAT family protein [Bifidobacterium catulorum]PWG58926.1 N-acetyltransferase [Bifidobacterium catulorum]